MVTLTVSLVASSFYCCLNYNLKSGKVTTLHKTSWPRSWLWTTEPYKDASFIPSHDDITCYQRTCLPNKCSKQLFLENSTTFPVFCCPCTNLFKMSFCRKIQKKYRFSKMYNKIFVFVLFSVDYISKQDRILFYLCWTQSLTFFRSRFAAIL